MVEDGGRGEEGEGGEERGGKGEDGEGGGRTSSSEYFQLLKKKANSLIPILTPTTSIPSLSAHTHTLSLLFTVL